MPQTIDNMSVTWTNSLTTYTGIKLNATGSSDANSAAGSLLMDLQVGGVSQAYILKSGTSFFGAIRTAPLYGYGDTASARTDNTANRNFAFTGTSLQLRTGGHFGFTSGDAAGAADTILTRRAAANLRLGAADAAAPVAQTLSVQSVVAGTTNTAGANLTITGSQGTGTGAGGSIVFQVAPAGSSGTAQNALATALTIDGAGRIQSNIFGYEVNNNTNTLFSVQGTALIQRAGSTIQFTTANYWQQLEFFTAATNRMTINPSGTVSIGGLTIDPSNGGTTFQQTFAITMQTSNAFVIRHGNSDGLDVRPVSSGSPNIHLKNASNAIQAALWGEANNTLALRNGANAQTFRVYNTTDGTNSEFGSLRWSGNEFIIGTDKTGTGVSRVLKIVKGGVTITINDGGTALAADRAIQAASGGSQEYGFLVGGVRYESGGTGIASINGGTSSSGAALQLREMAAPAAPATDNVRIYAEDNGSGKTRLMALFPTGAAVQIAIEP